MVYVSWVTAGDCMMVILCASETHGTMGMAADEDSKKPVAGDDPCIETQAYTSDPNEENKFEEKILLYSSDKPGANSMCTVCEGKTDFAAGCEQETECAAQTSLCCKKNNLTSTGEVGAGKSVTAEGSVSCTVCGEAFHITVDKMSPLSDALLSAVGMKPCGEPEECTQQSSDESCKVKDMTTPTDETYITAGVGLMQGSSDMVNTSKLVSVCGESQITGVIMSDEHCENTESDLVSECCPQKAAAEFIMFDQMS